MKWMRGLLLLGLFSAAGVTLSNDDDSDSSRAHKGVEPDRYLEAAAAAQRGDYVVAYCFWRPLAEQGDAEAQYALGWMYHNGYGLVTNDLAAKEWWERAVAQGHADAMFSLGTLYSVGSGTIARDYANAMRLWVKAAASGHVNARYALRELAQRNLPELTAMTSSLRRQYPHLLPATAKGAKANKSGSNAVKSPLEHYLRSGALMALAAGYRPEVGWATTYLVREGKILVSDLTR